MSILDTVARENPAIVALDKHLRQGRRKSKVPVELVVSEMTNNGSMEMVKETTSYAREFGIGITVSCAGPDSEEYSTRNEASSCLRNVIERNPLGGMRSLGNEGAGPTDRHLRVQRSRRDQRLSRRPTAQHQSARTVIDHRFRRCLSWGKHVSSLTTTRQSSDLIARQCIDLILEAWEGKVDQNYFVLPTQLVERDSCASPSLL